MPSLLTRARNKGLQQVFNAFLRPEARPDLVRLGSGYGGWWVPREFVGPGRVAYCAGAGEDITFDLALHEAGCVVRTFDPTPRAIVYVREHAPPCDRFRFEPVGWWSEERTLRFYAPRDPEHVSHSALNLQRTTEYFDAQVKTVRTLMTELGDTQVDLIKMDIEGAEYAVIDSFLSQGPLPAVLCVEFDQPQPARRALDAVRRLTAAGYTLNRVEGWNCTFSRG
jgi:FkbM family methyltransferase